MRTDLGSDNNGVSNENIKPISNENNINDTMSDNSGNNNINNNNGLQTDNSGTLRSHPIGGVTGLHRGVGGGEGLRAGGVGMGLGGNVEIRVGGDIWGR